jgi:hypothetical protein
MSQSHDKFPINSFLAQQQLPCTATASLHSNSSLAQQQLPCTATTPLHSNSFLAQQQLSFVAISTDIGKYKKEIPRYNQ